METRKRWSCVYPGRARCQQTDDGAYDDEATCNRHCKKVDAMRADEPELQVQMGVYSNGDAEGLGGDLALRYSAEKGRYVVAARAIKKWTRILTAPAVIVDGPSGIFDVCVALPKLLSSVPDIGKLWSGEIDPALIRQNEGLLPLQATRLAEAIRKNIFDVDGTGRLYAVSFVPSMIEHNCIPNAKVIVGRYPVAHYGVPGSWQPDIEGKEAAGTRAYSLQPAVAVYALHDIAKGEAISISYGACGDMEAKYGFVCKSGPRGRPCGMHVRIARDEGRGKLNDAIFSLEPEFKVVAPTFASPSWRRMPLHEFAIAMMQTHNAVVPDAPITAKDAMAMVCKWVLKMKPSIRAHPQPIDWEVEWALFHGWW